MAKPTSQRGFAILLAILLVSIVLTVGLTLFNITYRQLLLSSLARESQYAFYASDSARYCARYYDFLTTQSDRPFGYLNSAGDAFVYDSNTVVDLQCGKGDISLVDLDSGDPDKMVFRFTAHFSQDGRDTCADVEVVKYLDPDTPDLEHNLGDTQVTSRGYNNYKAGSSFPCHNGTDRTVERASRMLY